jgi:tetratricopeptide (TPR) repeat protein
MKPSRNDPCPCGSGAKYKRCCGAHAPTGPSSGADGSAGLRALLQLAVGHHQSGRLTEAEGLYRQIAAAYPDCADAPHLLGVIAYTRGQHQEADRLLREALSLNPAVAEFYNNHGNVLKALGRLGDALNSYGRALDLNPDYADAHNNLGLLLKEQGRVEEAAGHYRRAVEIQPSHAMAYSNLGSALQALHRTEEAFIAHRKAIALAPSSPGVWTSVGVTLSEDGKIDEAIRCHKRALEIHPEFVDALVNLGNALAKREMHEEALANYRRALQIQPDNALILNNMGALLEGRGRITEAVDCYRRALALNGRIAATYSNLGAAVKKLGRLEEALHYYEQAIQLQPSAAQAHWNRSLALLAGGRLEEGWQEYEWGWISQGRKPVRPFPQPRWEGQPIEGKTILVHGEQGVGDELIFASMLPDLLDRGARLVVECDRRLVDLFERSFASTEAVPRNDPPHPRTLTGDIDYFSAAGSLARFLRPSVTSFPPHTGYLKAEPRRRAEYRNRLRELGPGGKVGICWRSKMRTPTRSLEYTTIDMWGPILQVPGVHFVNLQYDECRRELDQARELFGVQIHAFDDVDLMNDLDGAAALTDALDLVITAATAVATTAGALGKSVWQYQFVASGDWLTFGTDTIPWFPSTRRFDRRPEQDWDEVIARVAGELSRLTAGQAFQRA